MTKRLDFAALNAQLQLAPRSASWGDYEFGTLPEMPEITCRFAETDTVLYEMPEITAGKRCRQMELRIRLRLNGLDLPLAALDALEISGDLMQEERLAPLTLMPLDEDPATQCIVFPRCALLPEFRLQCASMRHPEGCFLTFVAVPDEEMGTFFRLLTR